MKLLALRIENFRGIKSANLVFGDHTVLIGPNGSGKSTVIDALSLVFARQSLVRDLTEHDFYGSCPTPTTRIRIIATLGGFVGNDPSKHDTWFRDGRAVPKWWNSATSRAEPEQHTANQELCAEIGFSARFDLEELAVEQVRYFHDDDASVDPFDDESVVQPLPARLLNDIGYYLLPVRRTWEGAVSFTSELFRKAVASAGGVPAECLLEERDNLRHPARPLEKEQRLQQLIAGMNNQLRQLLPEPFEFQLRVTSTDSDSLLRALIPHYAKGDAVSLPAARQGTGLLSLQTLTLLLEIGRERAKEGLPFLLALEEPELHIAPGLQRRLIAEAVQVAGQTICTTHAPRVATFFPPSNVRILEIEPEELRATPLLATPLHTGATNAIRKLYGDDRTRLIEALMHHRVLIPEGRSEYEWFRLWSDAVETCSIASRSEPTAIAPPFTAVVGVVPTHNAAVSETYTSMRRLRSGISILVDGDSAGDSYVRELLRTTPPPTTVLQWPEGWEIEDVLKWILEADEVAVCADIKARLEWLTFGDLGELIQEFKRKDGKARLKGNYLAYEEVAGAIRDNDACRKRAETLLAALTLACSSRHAESTLLVVDPRATAATLVLRFVP